MSGGNIPLQTSPLKKVWDGSHDGEADGSLGGNRTIGFCRRSKAVSQKTEKRNRFSNLKQMALLLAQRVGNSRL